METYINRKVNRQIHYFTLAKKSKIYSEVQFYLHIIFFINENTFNMIMLTRFITFHLHQIKGWIWPT